MLGVPEKYFRRAFDAGVILKGIDGVLETVGSFVLFFASPAQLTALVSFFTAQELIEDPKDAIANALSHFFQNFTGPTKYFGALYLLTHGIVKIVLVAGLLRNRLWAYPAAIAVFTFFAVYQLYYLTVQYSIGLTALTVLDVVVILLTWHEYRYVSRR